MPTIEASTIEVEDMMALSTPEWLNPAEHISSPTIRSVNTRLWMNEVNERRRPSQPYTLGTVPDSEWERLLFNGNVHSMYTMGMFEPSEAARVHAQQNLALYQKDFDPTLTIDTIVASPFALTSDTLNPALAANWEELDEQIERLGIEMFIDFVPNHVALDHPWREDHPDWLLHVPKAEFDKAPDRYLQYTNKTNKVYYFARAKHLIGGEPELWPDTLQIDYSNPEARQAMKNRLVALATHNVRVDTATLVNYHIFKRTWESVKPDLGAPWDFWGEAIPAAKQAAEAQGRHCVVLGEAYQDHWALEDFDVIYGSAFYGKLLDACRNPKDANDLKKELAIIYNDPHRFVVFLTNHDLRSSLDRFGDAKRTVAAATVTAFTQAAWMIQQNEEVGGINPPVQITKPYPQQETAQTRYLKTQYELLLRYRNSALVQDGEATLLPTDTAIIAQQFTLHDDGMVVCTNMSDYDNVGSWIPVDSQLRKEQIKILNLETGEYLAPENITDPQERGGLMYIELPAWGRQIIFYQT